MDFCLLDRALPLAKQSHHQYFLVRATSPSLLAHFLCLGFHSNPNVATQSQSTGYSVRLHLPYFCLDSFEFSVSWERVERPGLDPNSHDQCGDGKPNRPRAERVRNGSKCRCDFDARS